MRVRSADDSRARFDFLTITLHWLTAVLIVVQMVTGFSLQFARDSVVVEALLNFHRSTGALIWCVASLRLVWRSTFARFPPFPDGMPALQRWLAVRTEHVLYALLLFQPLTGVLSTLLLGEPFWLVLGTVPAVLPRNLDLRETMVTLHHVGAYCLLAVIAGHAGMALIHHTILRDDVLVRMAPWISRKPARRRGVALPSVEVYRPAE
jgi:cytochrome b561